MNEKEIKKIVDMLYPYFMKRMSEDGVLKGYVKTKNATVVSELSEPGTTVDVILPFDTFVFPVMNDTGETLRAKDVVVLMYWVDLKNAVAKYISYRNPTEVE